MPRTGDGPRRSSSGGDGARIRGVVAECRDRGDHTLVFLRGRREPMEAVQARCPALVFLPSYRETSLVRVSGCPRTVGLHVFSGRAAGHMLCLPPTSCTCVGGRSYYLPDHSFESQESPCLVSMLSAVCQACSMATMEHAPVAARSCSFARVISTRLAGTCRDASACE